MSGPSQLQAGQQEMDSVKAEIQQNLQAFVAARQAGNVNEIGLLGKRLEQLGEEKLVLRRAQAAGIPGAIASVDNSAGIMQALLAPFPETAFSKTLDVTSLAGLLAAPLACRVPLPHSQYQHSGGLFPELFCPGTTTSAHDLHPFLITALQASWPTGTLTEFLLTPFWDTVGDRLPEFAAGPLGIPVSEGRDAVDDTITTADKKRDYMLFLDNILVIGGEDKPMRHEMCDAQSELFLKHREQLLLYTMRSLLGRRRVLQLFINITRWLHSVHTLSLLPPPPPARLLQPFYRSSPYSGNSSAEQHGQVQLMFHFRSVEKAFLVPGGHIQELLNVYGLLHKLRLPGAIHCASLEVNGIQQLMKHPMDNVDQQTRNTTCFVNLRLHPVGARISLESNQQLCNLVNSLLATLAPVHAAGFVHRDVRLDNVVKGPDGWVLIDWDLAGRENQYVWWTGQTLPPAVRAGTETYTCKTDIWQIGQLVLSHAFPSASSAAYADKLMSGQVTSAAMAPTAEWND